MNKIKNIKIMETLRIEIINPIAGNILKDLANLNLISITKEKNQQTELKKLLAKLRNNPDTAPSLEEITKEVEEVRKERYGKKNS